MTFDDQQVHDTYYVLRRANRHFRVRFKSRGSFRDWLIEETAKRVSDKRSTGWGTFGFTVRFVDGEAELAIDPHIAAAAARA